MKLTADHAEIRRWVEEHGGHPGLVDAGDGRRRLEVAFNGGGDRISWDEFFERFDRESLALAYDPDGDGESRAKLVSR
jgi:hypothetical protein